MAKLWTVARCPATPFVAAGYPVYNSFVPDREIHCVGRRRIRLSGWPRVPREAKKMVRVSIDSVRVSLMSQHRIVVLKDSDTTRYLPIWIGPFEADAITIQLQNVEVARPLTYDLLKTAIEELGAVVEQVAITELRNDTFFAEDHSWRLNNRALGRLMPRPSDAIALAVRVVCPSTSRIGPGRRPRSRPSRDLDTGEAGAAGPGRRSGPRPRKYSAISGRIGSQRPRLSWTARSHSRRAASSQTTTLIFIIWSPLERPAMSAGLSIPYESLAGTHG